MAGGAKVAGTQLASAAASGNPDAVASTAESLGRGKMPGKFSNALAKVRGLQRRVQGGQNAAMGEGGVRVRRVVGNNMPHKGRAIIAAKRKLLSSTVGMIGTTALMTAFYAHKNKAGAAAAAAGEKGEGLEGQGAEGLAGAEGDLGGAMAGADGQAGDLEAGLGGGQQEIPEGSPPELFAAFGVEPPAAPEAEEEEAPDIELEREDCDGVRTERGPGGKIMAAQELDADGLMDGAAEEYDEDGNVRTQAFYVAGKIQGPLAYFDPDGNQTQEIAFDEGKLDGRTVTYDADGKREQDVTFKQGNLDGEALFYREGRIVMKMTYNDGIAEGPASSFDDLENLLMESTYARDKLNGPAKSYSKAGIVVRECSYLEGQMHGECIDFYPTGQPMRSAMFMFGKLDGPVVEYGEDGHIRREEAYKNDLQEGDSIGYYPNGVVMEKAIFREGRRKGDPQRFDTHGDKMGKDNAHLTGGGLKKYLRKFV